MKKYVFPLFCYAILSCQNNMTKTNLNQKDSATILNNRANDLVISYGYDKDSMSKAVILYKDALRMDSLAINPYNNLISIYLEKKQKQDAYFLIDKLIQKKPDYIEGYLMKGHFFEKNSNINEARSMYETAIEKYNAILKSEPNNHKIMTSLIYANLFIKSKQEVYKEIQLIEEKYPQSKEIVAMKIMVEAFDKEKILKKY